ncbi:DTW domain-containing protein [Vibrio coralliilyticus]|uniref:tRNA-uridine aminocarboxypropyltransferase n=1 Tax=Vibrio TaxID=662 RepID=UPI000BAAB63A|nr:MULTISPECIES: DTW domain-containing protein [Vibrio]NOH61923.1 DTW domain-containing protein [Vibrio sp. RE88]PAU38530.1 DTW domain-containing protein [Vibrio coralliilyticus]QIJ85584.1 DTW domain-containing protein [Vibrio coralliilyticus OCN008]
MSRYCSQCGKSLKACICEWIQSLTSNVELVILQHPTETNRPMGTARILRLSLENSYLFEGENFTQHSELNKLLDEEGYQHFVLYPGEVSVSHEEVAKAVSSEGKVRIILLDGTWKKAYKMWQLSENLQALPLVRLPENLQGNYRIRKAPSDNSLSTVEAGYHILTLLQPEQDFTPLLDTFNHMIDFQIKQMPPGVFEKNYL